MFQNYVITASLKERGGPVDFDRASYLMDKTLLRQAIRAMNLERFRSPRHDTTYGAQWIWDYYCQRHFEKYGTFFPPDADPTWDA